MAGRKRKNNGPLVCQYPEKTPLKIIKKYFLAGKFLLAAGAPV